MTINELEQGLRNLITADPAVLSGNLGEVIRGVMGVAEAYHNYIYRVQSYPVQDVFKFSLLSETGKLENNIAGLAMAMLQERGINLLLYIPEGVLPYGNGYASNMYNPAGQMTYNPNMTMGAAMKNGNMSEIRETNPMFGKPNSIMQSMGQPVMNSMMAKPKASATYSSHKPTGKPTYASVSHNDEENAELTLKENAEESEVSDIKRRNEKGSVEANFNTSQMKEKEEERVEKYSAKPAEMTGGSSSEKASGRDYLLELLKK